MISIQIDLIYIKSRIIIFNISGKFISLVKMNIIILIIPDKSNARVIEEMMERLMDWSIRTEPYVLKE